MGEYVSEMIAALDSLGSAGTFWHLGRVDRIGIKVARKLGLI
jgi:hypothetical protein